MFEELLIWIFCIIVIVICPIMIVIGMIYIEEPIEEIYSNIPKLFYKMIDK